jgi:DnaK suppressor protein
MKEYDKVRDVLNTLLEELNNRLDNITHDVRHDQNPLEHDFAEQATQNENNEVIDQLGNSARAEIEQIKLAITNIDNGCYGICELCAEPISKERLAAVPFTSQCIKCASQAGPKH